MDIDAFIASGILENYCLGFCQAEEALLVEQNAEKYPAIKTALNKIRLSLETHLLNNQVKPSGTVKARVMQAVYRQLADTDHSYFPLVDENTAASSLAEWVEGRIADPPFDYSNLFITELPSTAYVTNFIVHARKGHEMEMHDDFTEYLYIVNGACTMDFEGLPVDYKEGDIIRIRPGIQHTATVTSALPMVAVVQRQFN